MPPTHLLAMETVPVRLAEAIVKAGRLKDALSERDGTENRLLNASKIGGFCIVTFPVRTETF